eukprot:TRINITY_DN2070_c0_g1_i25.p1 TRINITY_DN2070_c0_g1~~TRINITY_DN2070_c0_g1_i25.p1  ORF type:complete len:429 (+),score=84.65 TRINITY_DN2070_c0_g1_i25:183-1469(+)
MNPHMQNMMTGVGGGGASMYNTMMQNPYGTMHGGYGMSSMQNMHSPSYNNQPMSAFHDAPVSAPMKKEKLRVNLAPSERGHYSNLFDVACPKGKREIEGRVAAAFLSRSGLPNPTLKTIWSIAAQDNSRALNKEDFYVALRLVGLAQGGKEVSENAIRQNVSAPLPRFEGADTNAGGAGNAFGEAGARADDPGKYTITNQELQKYMAICNNVDKDQKGYLDSAEMNLVLQKTHLAPNVVNTLKMIGDEQGMGRFSLPTAIAMIHLAVLSMKKVPLPRSIPIDLKRRAESYVNSSGAQDFGAAGRKQSALSNEYGSKSSMASKTSASAMSTVVNDELVAAIRKELKDKRTEVTELKEEENETKERLNHLKEQNKGLASYLQKIKEEVTEIKKTIVKHKISLTSANHSPNPVQTLPFTPSQTPVQLFLIA